MNGLGANETSSRRGHILIVDDEVPLLRALGRFLTTAGFEVTTDNGRKISLDNFGGKVLVPTSQFVRTLVAARLAGMALLVLVVVLQLSGRPARA